MLSVQYINSPLGILKIEASDRWIERLSFVENSGEENPNILTQQTATELALYFKGDLKEFTLPLNLQQGTEFQQKAWVALCKIPYGQTCSYKEQAEKIGAPKACRAIGGANNKNPLPILVPCHRVLGAKGQLVGYAGGLAYKQKLLELEKEAI